MTEPRLYPAHPMTNTERKRLAVCLVTANVLVNDAKRGAYGSRPKGSLSKASDLIQRVIGDLMDAPGMTDFYGNSTDSQRGERK